MMVNRNIYISYVLAFSKHTWFWYAVWVFYYLRYTNYAGIGIIETVLIITFTLAEIPTGAIADIFGKRITLILSFLLQIIGNLIMAMALNFQMLILSVAVMCIGGALYSGTLDALVFDSLKQQGKEKEYDKKLSNIKTISLVTIAICGALGGFLYNIYPALPFYANALGYLLGLLASLFIIEPYIDTEKFTFKGFLGHMSNGVFELFKSQDVRRIVTMLLSVSVFIVLSWEMLDSFLAVEYGFGPVQLGVVWSVIYLVSALASQLTSSFRKVFNENLGIILLGLGIAITFILSPLLGLVLGGLSIALRSSFQSVFENLASVVINNHTESRYRATTISAFNMIKNVPYILSAFFIGSISDRISAKTTAFYLGIVLLVLILLQVFRASKKRYN